MEIWKAELVLGVLRNEYVINFYFEEQNEDYRLSSDRSEYVYSEGWSLKRIPIKMTVNNDIHFIMRISQGFNRELSKTEIKDLEIQMKEFMKAELLKKKEIYLSNLEKQLEIIK